MKKKRTTEPTPLPQSDPDSNLEKTLEKVKEVSASQDELIASLLDPPPLANLDPELARLLRATAKEHGVNVGDLMCYLVRHGLRQVKEGVLAIPSPLLRGGKTEDAKPKSK